MFLFSQIRSISSYTAVYSSTVKIQLQLVNRLSSSYFQQQYVDVKGLLPFSLQQCSGR